MGINKRLAITLGIIVVILGAFMIWQKSQRVAPPETGRVISVEEYVSQNISELSPVKEQVGGRFYITDIETQGDTGLVSYEDGHNAYTADFEYTIDEGHGGIRITSFIVRP